MSEYLDTAQLAIGILKNEAESNSGRVWSEIAGMVATIDIKEHLEEVAKQSYDYDVYLSCYEYITSLADKIRKEEIGSVDIERHMGIHLPELLEEVE